MTTLLLLVIYIAFISLGIPDSLFGTAWPAIYSELTLPISYGSFVTIIISCGTIISSLLSSRLLARFGTGFICIFSTALTAIALLLFSFSNNFYLLCFFALPLGLGAGAIDIALNNYVALHYSAIHMSFLHCFYGVGVSASPYILSKIIGSQGNWRIGYQTAASIQFAILLLLIATITLWSKTKISVSSASVRHGSSLSFRTIVRMPGVKEICCMFITSCGIEYTCGNWCSTFLVENKNMPIANAAQVVMLYYIGLTLGRFCSGLLAVRLHSWKIIRLGQIVLGAGILLLFMPFLTRLAALERERKRLLAHPRHHEHLERACILHDAGNEPVGVVNDARNVHTYNPHSIDVLRLLAQPQPASAPRFSPAKAEGRRVNVLGTIPNDAVGSSEYRIAPPPVRPTAF